MAKYAPVNKIISKTVDKFDKARQSLEVVTQLSSGISDIARRVARDGIIQARSGTECIVNISTRPLNKAREGASLKDILQTQLNATTADVRTLAKVGHNTIDVFSGGVTDTLEMVFQAYGAHRKEGTVDVPEVQLSEVKPKPRKAPSESASTPRSA